jgi:transposase-like protein
MSDLQNPIFTDEIKAREALEASRWPNGPICAHCGATERQARVEGTKKSHRPGLVYCNECKTTYTVTVGTCFERSKVPLTKWWLATHLLTSSKKGMSAHQMHRLLGVTYKTAWFMCHRIREAMDDKTSAGPLGGEGKTVEADETFLGPARKELINGKMVSPTGSGRHKVIALVERGGKVRSLKMHRFNSKSVKNVLHKHVDLKSTLNTDQAGHYRIAGYFFEDHQNVNHTRKEYKRGDTTTNTIEGVFSIFKRGMIGTYQHCGEQHLPRYLAEFDFRYNNRIALGITDAMRALAAMKGIEGKRLTYRRSRLGTETDTQGTNP